MTATRRRALSAVALGLGALLLLVVLGMACPGWAAPDQDTAAQITAIIRGAHLPEPLIAAAPTIQAEDSALANAITTYERRSTPDDFSSLTAFLSTYPHSGWAPALQTNLGFLYLHYGYFSRAIDAWQSAWKEGKGATEPRAKVLVDRAVGELARLDAGLGHLDDLAKLLDQVGNRPLTGSATEDEQVAREQLTLVHTDPRHLFNCGPVALEFLMLSGKASPDRVRFLPSYRAGPNGTNLAEVSHLADKADFPHRLVFRQPGQPVPVPSIVHWKVGHFAAIVGAANGRFHIQDPVFASHELWVMQGALDAEASGYFLVPADEQGSPGWRAVGDTEASGVWGKGPTNQTPPGLPGPQDTPANGPGNSPNSPSGPGTIPLPPPPAPPAPPNPCPMCGYNIGESTVSLSLSDTPVGYAPPIGPSARVSITYNQREASQPANFNFFNVSPKWTLNWLTYVMDDPGYPGENVSRYIAGGGAYYYSGYNSATGWFTAQNDDGSILVLTSQNPISYQRQLADGSIEVYAQTNGSTSFPRNIFLSQVIDPQGNTVTLNYTLNNGQTQLTSLTDAAGRQTTFTYGLAAFPLLITQITDPFGRSAMLSYDSSGRLSSITDVIGLTSSFTYDANSLVNSMTTPYGTTNFAYTAPGTSGPPRFVQVTDPMGFNEREEWLEPAPIADADPTYTIPQGMPVGILNEFLSYRDSFHWDKSAYVAAGCTPTGGCNYALARDRHFNDEANLTATKSGSIESVKYPFENRIWFQYPGQTLSYWEGIYKKPAAVGRVLDDGTTQLSQFSYDTSGYFNLTQAVDAIGRTTSYAYANHVDISAISQTTAYGLQTIIAQFMYNTQHRPVLYRDAAGRLTSYTYNAAGQLTSVTNPLNQTTSFQYDATGDLMTIVNANASTAASFTYDAFDRIATYTDAGGWTVAYSYDNADRVTSITYPDGTTETYTYNKLDLASYLDRLGRVWAYTHDADRRLTMIADPLGHQTLIGYNPSGVLTSLTDPRGNTTTWTYDVEERLIGKQYPDGSTVANTYENSTSRLKYVTDALGQVKQFTYAEDNRPTSIFYLNPVNPTPNVSFVYDQYFPRRVSMTDGTGTTQYAYVPVGSLGALRLQQETGPVDTINYSYDALGRLSSRTVGGDEGTETWQYDALGRVTGDTNDLGAFTLSYLAQTPQIASRTLAGSQLAIAWSYLPNSGDRRLSEINITGPVSGQYSTYRYTSMPEIGFTGITETSDASAVYPSPSAQTVSYNNLNQIRLQSVQPFTYDLNGNLLSDGQRNYTWDAENRLIGITYPAQPGQQTNFSYDGLSRRTAITHIPVGGGGGTTEDYVWCGSRICQERNASSGAVAIELFPEGQSGPGGSPGSLTPYFYGQDQIGTARRVFSQGTGYAYSYDPYGNALQTTTPVAVFNYAGMFYESDSGLSLTQFRAYDPNSGRWLSRDPIGETANLSGNLYAYVGGNPIIRRDPNGEYWWVIPLIVAAVAIVVEQTEETLEPIIVPPPAPPVPPPVPQLAPPGTCDVHNPAGNTPYYPPGYPILTNASQGPLAGQPPSPASAYPGAPESPEPVDIP